MFIAQLILKFVLKLSFSFTNYITNKLNYICITTITQQCNEAIQKQKITFWYNLTFPTRKISL